MSRSEEILRKPDPTIKRRNIYVATLNKVKSFLKDQIEPVFKSEIVRSIGINYDSLNFALNIIPNVKTNKEGKIHLNKKGGEEV